MPVRIRICMNKACRLGKACNCYLFLLSCFAAKIQSNDSYTMYRLEYRHRYCQYFLKQALLVTRGRSRFDLQVSAAADS